MATVQKRKPDNTPYSTQQVKNLGWLLRKARAGEIDSLRVDTLPGESALTSLKGFTLSAYTERDEQGCYQAYETHFASWWVFCGWLKRCRSLHGLPLLVCGGGWYEVSKDGLIEKGRSETGVQNAKNQD